MTLIPVSNTSSWEESVELRGIAVFGQRSAVPPCRGRRSDGQQVEDPAECLSRRARDRISCIDHRIPRTSACRAQGHAATLLQEMLLDFPSR